MDCPEISELAGLAEGGEVAGALKAHVDGCDACQEALKSLQEEVLSLQIPLSEIWFRDHISCPHGSVLGAYRDRKLEPDAQEYVAFHVEELACPYCQSRLEQGILEDSEEGRLSMRRSRQRVGEATSVLLDELGQRD